MEGIRSLAEGKYNIFVCHISINDVIMAGVAVIRMPGVDSLTISSGASFLGSSELPPHSFWRCISTSGSVTRGYEISVDRGRLEPGSWIAYKISNLLLLGG